MFIQQNYCIVKFVGVDLQEADNQFDKSIKEFEGRYNGFGCLIGDLCDFDFSCFGRIHIHNKILMLN